MRRSPEEIWQRLVDESGEDAIERAASVSVAQAEAELRLAGFDVAKERARADAFTKALTSEHGSGAGTIDGAPDADAAEPAGWVSAPPPASSRKSSVRWTLLLAAAMAAAATGGGVIYALAHRHPPQDKPVEAPQPPPGPPVAPQVAPPTPESQPVRTPSKT